MMIDSRKIADIPLPTIFTENTEKASAYNLTYLTGIHLFVLSALTFADISPTVINSILQSDCFHQILQKYHSVILY